MQRNVFASKWSGGASIVIRAGWAVGVGAATWNAESISAEACVGYLAAATGFVAIQSP